MSSTMGTPQIDSLDNATDWLSDRQGYAADEPLICHYVDPVECTADTALGLGAVGNPTWSDPPTSDWIPSSPMWLQPEEGIGGPAGNNGLFANDMQGGTGSGVTDAHWQFELKPVANDRQGTNVYHIWINELYRRVEEVLTYRT